MAYTEEEQNNIAAFRRLHESVINCGRLDEVASLMHPSCRTVRYGFASLGNLLAPDAGLVDRTMAGADSIEGFKKGLSMLKCAFPDYNHAINEIFAKNDWVAARWTLTCTHAGDFMGLPPTGKTISIAESGMMRFAGGMMLEGWFIGDELSLARQLGITFSRPA